MHRGRDCDRRAGGYGTTVADIEHEREAQRASALTPEEQAAGSDDADTQASAVLAESSAREEHARDDAAVERRTSDGADR